MRAHSLFVALALSNVILVHSVGDEIVNDSDGCCYSLGYGAMMKPCCLTTEAVAKQGACLTEDRIGGSTGYSASGCPRTASEADSWLKKAEAAHKHEQEPPVLVSSAAPASPQAPAAMASATPTNGCCYSFGFGARMEPCCLTTKSAVGVSACSAGMRLGGATGFSANGCPTTPAEAKKWLASTYKTHKKAEVEEVAAPPKGDPNVEAALKERAGSSDAGSDSQSSVSLTALLVAGASVLGVGLLVAGALAFAARRWHRGSAGGMFMNLLE